MTGRIRAAEALGRILRGGAWSNVLLGAQLGHGEDARFVRSLVYHALRTVGLAERVVSVSSKRPLERLDPAVGDVLRIAIAELHRGRTPPPIAVSEAVAAVKDLGSGRASGFVNAVLRRIVREGLPELEAADRLGVPTWLATTLDDAWGHEEARAFWEASSRPARVGLYGVPSDPAALTAVQGVPGSYLADAPLTEMTVVDPASVAVAQSLDVHADDLVLDMTAAPGGKTSILLDGVHGRGVVVAGELHPRRLRSAAGHLPAAQWVRMDATRAPFPQDQFDRVLLDAPCTGLGTLRRRPEILLRVTEAEVERLAGVQRRALEQALRVVRPGGRIVYSVCTVTPVEGPEQVQDLTSVAAPPLPMGRAAGSGHLLAPHLGPTDGMFIAVIEKD